MHIYWGYIAPTPIYIHQTPIAHTIHLWNTVTPNECTHISRMHIYWGYIYPPLQLTINLWNTVTPNRCTHIAECTYTEDTYTPPNSNWQYTYGIPCYTKWVSHISQNAHILRIHIPPTPIDNSSMEYHLHHISVTYSRMHIYWGYIYSFQFQLTIDLWNTITLNKLSHIA